MALPNDKLEEVFTLVVNWDHRATTNIHDLRTILGKLFYIAHCCPADRYFVNRMLDTLRQCPMHTSHHPVS